MYLTSQNIRVGIEVVRESESEDSNEEEEEIAPDIKVSSEEVYQVHQPRRLLVGLNEVAHLSGSPGARLC